ncbi:MAG TPA: type II toxin-antitoxin system prevent-host-death family antitoxin [Schlesneria sp.]
MGSSGHDDQLEYDQDVKHRQISATELKAKCLALLDEVNQSGETIVITKRGKPVVTVQPVKKQPWKSIEGALADSTHALSDLPPEFNFAEEWEMVRLQDAMQLADDLSNADLSKNAK